MTRVTLPQSKVRARRKRQRILVTFFTIVAVLVLFGVLVWLAHASFLRITSVEVSGQSTLDPEDISQAVLADIAGSYGYLFPKNNIFLYPKHSSEVALAEQMPTIATVSINAKNFHTLGVVVTERARKALWCGQSVINVSPCIWLDQDGLAYAAVSDVSLALDSASSTYERYYGALTNETIPHYLSPDQFHALSALVDALAQNQAGNPITTIEVDYSGVARITFADSFVLQFNLSAASADVYRRFTLALTSDVFLGHTLSDFEYLDLRFGDKLYYKLRASSTPATSNK